MIRTLLTILMVIILASGLALGQTTPGPKLLALRQAQATPPPVSVGLGAAVITSKGHFPVAITLSCQLTQTPGIPVFFEALGTSDWQYGGAVTTPISTFADPFSRLTHITWSPGFEKVLQGTNIGPAALTNELKFSAVTWGVLLQWNALNLGF
jgi:hypothetical protein